jgi:hypothetical protein
MATGTFASFVGNVLRAPNVIYTSAPTPPAPTTVSTRPPSNRLPVSTSGGGGGLTVPGTVYPVNVDPIGNTPQPVSPLGGSGGGFVPSAPSQPGPTATGTDTGTSSGGSGSTGANTSSGGGSGQSDTSRLLDLVAGAFQPQEMSQTYGPQSVSSDAMGSGGGTNPMAVIVFAILIMAGIFFYAHRKSTRRVAA